MGYDGASYRSQLNDDEDKKELCEVVTLILYFGNGHWDTSKELRDTFAKKGNVEKYANNYKLNVFEIAYLYSSGFLSRRSLCDLFLFSTLSVYLFPAHAGYCLLLCIVILL